MATSLEELKVLQITETLADEIWKQVTSWEKFPRDTIGNQLARAVDSIGANIAESFGRFHYSEKINHLYYSRGSLFETKYWINRCKTRKLLSTETAEKYALQLTEVARQINTFVNSLKSQRANQPKTLRELPAQYLEVNTEIHLPIYNDEELAYLNL